MHVIIEESEAADILPLKHMFLYASSFTELIIKCFEKRRKKNPRETEGCSSQCSHQPVQRPSQIHQCLHHCLPVLVSGQALPPAPPQLTAAPGTGLGDIFPCSCSQNNQQGWLNQVERPLFPRSLAWGTEGRNCKTPCPRTQMEDLMEEPFPHQRSHANSIYHVTGTKYPSKVMLTCQPRKNSHSCINCHFYSSFQDKVIPSDDCEEVLVKASMAQRLMDSSYTSEKIIPSLRSHIAGAVDNTQAESMVCLW